MRGRLNHGGRILPIGMVHEKGGRGMISSCGSSVVVSEWVLRKSREGKRSWTKRSCWALLLQNPSLQTESAVSFVTPTYCVGRRAWREIISKCRFSW